jgi:chemotaxis protein histidine kinase CheA
MGFGGGLGFGLTISKMILEQLGGDISCESVEGKGSTFTYSIPVREAIPYSLHDESSLAQDRLIIVLRPIKSFESNPELDQFKLDDQVANSNSMSNLLLEGGGPLASITSLSVQSGVEKKSQ